MQRNKLRLQMSQNQHLHPGLCHAWPPNSKTFPPPPSNDLEHGLGNSWKQISRIRTEREGRVCITYITAPVSKTKSLNAAPFLLPLMFSVKS